MAGINKAFDVYNKLNEESIDKKLKIEKPSENPIIENFREFKLKTNREEKDAINYIDRIEYDIKNIEDFFLSAGQFKDISEYIDQYLDVYVPVLINKIGTEKDYIKIDLRELNTFLQFYLNCVGQELNGPTLELFGEVRMVGTEMKKGKIIANDDTFIVGNMMRGGEIIVNGNTHYVGMGMRGGIICLNGDYELIYRDRKSGSIYHKGKLIWYQDNDLREK